MSDRLDPRLYTLTPTPNPGMAAAHRLGLPYLVVDEHGSTQVLAAARAANEERNTP